MTLTVLLNFDLYFMITEQISNSHEVTKFSRQIQDQWIQLRSNAPSAKAEREHAVIAFSNSSPNAKHSGFSSIISSLSLSDSVSVQTERSTHNSHTSEKTEISDGDNQNELNEVINHDDQDKIVEFIDQNGRDDVCEYMSGVCPSQKNRTSKQVQFKKPAEEAVNKSITVSISRTHHWRKHNTNGKVRKAWLYAIWKQQGGTKLAREKEAQKKLIGEGTASLAEDSLRKNGRNLV